VVPDQAAQSSSNSDEVVTEILRQSGVAVSATGGEARLKYKFAGGAVRIVQKRNERFVALPAATFKDVRTD